MAQRDYVRRGQPSAPSQRKKSNKKQSSLPAVLPMMGAIVAAVLVAFIGGRYFIKHHSKEDAEALQCNKLTGSNSLLPQPEERWHYIKELESRQPGVRWPTEPSAREEVKKANQIIDEHRHQQKQTTLTASQPSAPIIRDAEAPKQTAEKKNERRWMIQCGSFKGVEQAETVRAQLAFEGFHARITTNNGWNRVVIGPVKGKKNADGTINRLKVLDHSNCIRLASGG